jgi:hypothetical protein
MNPYGLRMHHIPAPLLVKRAVVLRWRPVY